MGVAGCRYVGVGESEEVQLFYYFVESPQNSTTKPLVLWLNGGNVYPCMVNFFGKKEKFPAFLGCHHSHTSDVQVLVVLHLELEQ